MLLMLVSCEKRNIESDGRVCECTDGMNPVAHPCMHMCALTLFVHHRKFGNSEGETLCQRWVLRKARPTDVPMKLVKPLLSSSPSVTTSLSLSLSLSALNMQSKQPPVFHHSESR